MRGHSPGTTARCRLAFYRRKSKREGFNRFRQYPGGGGEILNRIRFASDSAGETNKSIALCVLESTQPDIAGDKVSIDTEDRKEPEVNPPKVTGIKPF